MSAPLAAATCALLKKPGLQQLVVAQLVLLHQITRASVPLMEAARRVAESKEDDDVCRMLVPYLAQHIAEEQGHDQWILEDLESIGIDRVQVLSALPSAHVAGLVGAQYYWILHHHPVALLGYMLMLEANAPTMTMVDYIKACTGFPESLFRAHRVHAALDPDHQAGMYDLIDRLPLRASQERLVSASLMHTGECMADCLGNPKSWNQSFGEYAPLESMSG
jgi:hypothetical protein